MPKIANHSPNSKNSQNFADSQDSEDDLTEPTYDIYSFAIGLTGGIASGKSTVAHILRQAGYQVLDADQLTRELMAPGTELTQKILATFGPAVSLERDHQPTAIDRKALGALVFAEAEARATLEKLVHPALQTRLTSRMQEAMRKEGRSKLWFYEAALLFETGTYRRFKEVWLCDCPQSVQLARLQKRDGLDTAAAQQRLAAQWPAERKRALATRWIDTDTKRSALKGAVLKAVQAATRAAGLPAASWPAQDGASDEL